MDRYTHRVLMRYWIVGVMAVVLLLLVGTIEELNQPGRIAVPEVRHFQMRLEEPPPEDTGTSATSHR